MSIIGGVLLLLFPPFFVWVFYLLFMIGWWSSRGWEWSLPIIGVLLLLVWYTDPNTDPIFRGVLLLLPWWL